MRLSELIEDVRDIASVHTANRWVDKDLVRFLNKQHRSLARMTAHVNQKYHSHTIQVPATAGRLKHTGLFTYRLPPWVMKVAAVRRSTTTPTTNARYPNIPRRDQNQVGGGWDHGPTGEFELESSAAVDLELDVAKLPALLTKGTLPTPGAVASNQMRLDADNSVDAQNFPHEDVKDSYAGALFEITGPASARKGQLLRCVGSLHGQGGSTNETILTMEEAWASVPVAADTYEMHAEFGGEHCRLLTLLTARALFAQERNLNGIAAIGPEVAEQWSIFTESIAERDQAGPHLVVDSIGATRGVPAIYDQEVG